jgi:hypothetical protein
MMNAMRDHMEVVFPGDFPADEPTGGEELGVDLKER